MSYTYTCARCFTKAPELDTEHSLPVGWSEFIVSSPKRYIRAFCGTCSEAIETYLKSKGI